MDSVSEPQNATTGSAPAAGTLAVSQSDKLKPPYDFIIFFSKKFYEVPRSAVAVLSKYPCELENPQELEKIQGTKAPDQWYKLCHPNHLVQLRCEEGLVNYTHVKFKDGSFPQEYRYLIHLSKRICEVNFKKLHDHFTAFFEENPSKAPTSASAKARYQVLAWKPEQCPNAAQLNPEVNRFAKAVDPPQRALASLSAPKTPSVTKKKGKDKFNLDSGIFEIDKSALPPRGIHKLRIVPNVTKRHRLVYDEETMTLTILELGKTALPPPKEKENRVEDAVQDMATAEEEEDDDDED